MGRDHFADFRRYFGTSGATDLIDNQYLVGSGIIPHNGPDGGIFVIDTKNRLAWAVVVDNAGPDANSRRWGVLTWQDRVPRKQIETWLAEKSVQPWRVKDVPLSQKAIDAYFHPRAKAGQPKPAPVAAALTAPASGPVDAPLEKVGGTFSVPVVINDSIKLNFIVDSGAADVSIPADVVMTLTRTGTVESSDDERSVPRLHPDDLQALIRDIGAIFEASRLGPAPQQPGRPPVDLDGRDAETFSKAARIEIERHNDEIDRKIREFVREATKDFLPQSKISEQIADTFEDLGLPVDTKESRRETGDRIRRLLRWEKVANVVGTGAIISGVGSAGWQLLKLIGFNPPPGPH